MQRETNVVNVIFYEDKKGIYDINIDWVDRYYTIAKEQNKIRKELSMELSFDVLQVWTEYVADQDQSLSDAIADVLFQDRLPITLQE